MRYAISNDQINSHKNRERRKHDDEKNIDLL